MSVSQAAFHVAYGSAHFATIFRKRFGISPDRPRRWRVVHGQQFVGLLILIESESPASESLSLGCTRALCQ
ncbi:hypothetical protein [Bradyrhizobium iriomotense]|uniref:hypothetical protein n=1 Tax=Bradyrhizobium iriomotense TaxID=441950 RepID=UPI003D9BE4F7